MSNNVSFKEIFKRGAVLYNPVLVQLVGLCPVIAASTTFLHRQRQVPLKVPFPYLSPILLVGLHLLWKPYLFLPCFSLAFLLSL